MTTHTVDFLVVGAGPTGLGAAVRLAELGADHLVVEAAAGPGGMASSVRDRHGFTWDLGGHVIHSHFAEFDKAIAASAAPMLSVQRHGRVWMDGALHAMPIQQNLLELPDDLRPDAPAENLLEHYRNQFGAALTGRFFAPYSEKMWAHPLERTAHEWTSLRGGSGARNVPRIGLAADRVERPAEYFPYPRGGTGALWTAVHETLTDVDRFRFGTEVVALDLERRVATLGDGRTVRYTTCITTAPLTTTLGWTGLEAAASGADLVTSTVHAVGFGFDGAPPELIAGLSYLQSPDRDVPWYRATMLGNYDPGNAGDGRWSVLCEVSTSASRPITVQDAVARSRASLAGLGADLDRLVSVWTRLVPMGYPVPTLGRDAVLHEADDALRRHGVHSRGRFGGWRYESCNQDYSFAQGIEAVAHVLDGTPEDVYWRPELF